MLLFLFCPFSSAMSSRTASVTARSTASGVPQFGTVRSAAAR